MWREPRAVGERGQSRHRGRLGAATCAHVRGLAAAACTGRASRHWGPCDVPFAESQLRYSTIDIIRLLKQGICNLCFPAMVTVHQVNPKDLFFNRYTVAVTVAAVIVKDVLV